MNKKEDKDDEFVMYVLVNNDLKMAKGKIASQCMHSVCNATRILERLNKRDNNYMKWIKNGEAKIVLKSTEIDMTSLIDTYEVDIRVKRDSSDIWCVHTRDAGKTQIAADSLTTIVFRPILKTSTPNIIKKLQCL